MKNFRKVLALVLAVATLFSFAAMAGAAKVTFTDAGEITKNEAVDVLVDMGIINGYTDGSFGPKGDVTRAEMATMISKLMNSGEDINARWTNANTFADMAGVEWAAGHVAYNAAEGYIAGRNATTFAPNDKVTGAEAAKMLLCALGYDATYNGLVGADWSKNTVKLASKLGLFENVDSSPEEALNRENAAQILLNALEAPMVEFTAGSTTTVNGVTVVTGGTQEEKEGKIADSYTRDPADDVMHLVEEKFEGYTKTIGGQDAFGRAACTWTGIGTYGDEEVYKTYTGAVNVPTLFTDLGEIKGSEFADEDIYVYVNGTEEDAAAVAAWALVDAMDKYSKANQYISGAGDTVEVYYDRMDNTLRICIIRPYFGMITDVDEDAETAVITVGSDDYELEDVAYTENDIDTPVIAYVSAHLEGDEALVSHEKATVVTGALATFAGSAGTDRMVTVDGTVYGVGINAVEDIDLALYLGSQVTLYTDKNGAVFCIEAADLSAELKYAYVIAAGAETGRYGDTVGDPYAYLLFADGTAADVKLKATTGAVKAALDSSVKDNVQELVGNIYAYSESNGVYTLKETNLTSGTATAIRTGVATVGSHAATNKTVFVVDTALDDTNVINVTASVYTGIAKAPSVDVYKVGGENKGNVAYLVDKDDFVLIAFANEMVPYMGASSDVDAIFVTGDEKLQVVASDDEVIQYKEYTAIVDGAVTTIKINVEEYTAALSSGWNLFNGSTVIGGYYTNLNTTSLPTTYSIAASNWERYNNGLIKVDTGYMSVEEDTVAYIYNERTDKLSVSTVAKIGSKLSDSTASFYLIEDATAEVPVIAALYVAVKS